MIPSSAVLRSKVVPIQRCSFCCYGPADCDLLIESRVPGVYLCQTCLLVALQTLFDSRPKYVDDVKRLVAQRRGLPRTRPRVKL